MMQKFLVAPEHVYDSPDPDDRRKLTAYYLASEVDAVLKRQAAAAISGMDAAKTISSVQLQQAHRLRAESSPEALESERQANAILTERVAELEQALRAVVEVEQIIVGSPESATYPQRYSAAMDAAKAALTS